MGFTNPFGLAGVLPGDFWKNTCFVGTQWFDYDQPAFVQAGELPHLKSLQWKAQMPSAGQLEEGGAKVKKLKKDVDKGEGEFHNVEVLANRDSAGEPENFTITYPDGKKVVVDAESCDVLCDRQRHPTYKQLVNGDFNFDSANTHITKQLKERPAGTRAYVWGQTEVPDQTIGLVPFLVVLYVEKEEGPTKITIQDGGKASRVAEAAEAGLRWEPHPANNNILILRSENVDRVRELPDTYFVSDYPADHFAAMEEEKVMIWQHVYVYLDPILRRLRVADSGGDSDAMTVVYSAGSGAGETHQFEVELDKIKRNLENPKKAYISLAREELELEELEVEKHLDSLVEEMEAQLLPTVTTLKEEREREKSITDEQRARWKGAEWVKFYPKGEKYEPHHFPYINSSLLKAMSVEPKQPPPPPARPAGGIGVGFCPTPVAKPAEEEVVVGAKTATVTSDTDPERASNVNFWASAINNLESTLTNAMTEPEDEKEEKAKAAAAPAASAGPAPASGGGFASFWANAQAPAAPGQKREREPSAEPASPNEPPAKRTKRE